MISEIEADKHLGMTRNWCPIKFVSRFLVVAVWVSSAIFGCYILAFYGGAIPTQTLNQWNKHLPNLYDAQSPNSTLAMGFHLLAGSILLVLGPIQFIDQLRSRFPIWHRWIGRIYILSAMVAGIGGLTYILIKGTVGGIFMNVGFGLYGLLISAFAVQTFLSAKKLDFENHRAWAIRLLALVIGSWLYRVEYGFWSIALNEFGRGPKFSGPFDLVMDFFFYLPNLLVAELIIRSKYQKQNSWAKRLSVVTLSIACIFVVIGTYFFTRYYWGPAIINRLTSLVALLYKSTLHT